MLTLAHSFLCLYGESLLGKARIKEVSPLCFTFMLFICHFTVKMYPLDKRVVTSVKLLLW
jgi:hypothetical protein